MNSARKKVQENVKSELDGALVPAMERHQQKGIKGASPEVVEEEKARGLRAARCH